MSRWGRGFPAHATIRTNPGPRATVPQGVRLLIVEPIIGLTDQSTRIYETQQSNFSLTAGARGTATVTFIGQPDDAYEPTEGCQIYIQRVPSSGIPVTAFSGTIDQFEVVFIGDDGYRKITLTATSLEQQFDVLRVSPSRAYFGKSAGYIFQDLFGTVGGGIPLISGIIQSGPILDRVYDPSVSVSDAFNDLCTAAGFIWFVDPDANTLNFCLASSLPSIMIGDGDVLWESIGFKRSRQNFRDREYGQGAIANSPVTWKRFTPDGITKAFTLDYPIDSLFQVMLTSSSQGFLSVTFNANPAPGDAASIVLSPFTDGEPAYTFVTAIDNTKTNQVLIGGTQAATAQNFADALNGLPATVGVSYSLPTRENLVVFAGNPMGSSLKLTVKVPGDTYRVRFSSSSSAFGGSYIRQLTIDHTKCGSVDLQNFPCLVSITDATLKDIAHGGHVQTSQGFDIAFYSDSGAGSPLFWDIDFYDPVAGTVIAFVNIPTLSHTADTVFYMTYGTVGISSYQSFLSNVYPGDPASTGATGVYHFSDGTALNGKNSTHPDPTNHSGDATLMGSPTAVAGKINGAMHLNGTTQYAKILADQIGWTAAGNAGLSRYPAPVTVSVWAKADSTSAGIHRAFTNGDPGSNQLFSIYRDGADWCANALANPGGDTSVPARAVGAVSVGVWQRLLATYVSAPGVTSTLTLTVDANAPVSGTPDTPGGGGFGTPWTDALSSAWGVNCWDMASEFFDGAIDEGHMWASNPTSPAVEYTNQNNPGAFISVGIEALALSTFSGGSVPAFTPVQLQVGTDVSVVRGSNLVTLATAPTALHIISQANGVTFGYPQFLYIAYYRLGAEFRAVEDTALVAARAAIEHSTGRYQAVQSTGSGTPAASLIQLQQILAQFAVLPDEVSLITYVDGIAPTRAVVIAITRPLLAAGLINGTWQVQSVRAQFMPLQNGARQGNGCFLYSLVLTSTTQATWISFWENLAKR